MDPVANPFRPGAGRRPPLLAGREAVLDAFGVVRRRAEELGEGDRSWVLHGLRGVGKTVLLNELLAQVSDRGWITAKVEAGATPSLSVALSRALVGGLRTATGRHPEPPLRRLVGVFKAFSIKVDPTGAVAVGVDVEPIKGIADSGRLAGDLAALFEVLGETARDLGMGVLVLVDELQEADAEELAAVNTAVHDLGQAPAPLPLAFVGAGLPSLPAQLADATSYAERLYDYRPVGLLGSEASRDALTVPRVSETSNGTTMGSKPPSRPLAAIRTSSNRWASTCGTTPAAVRSTSMTSRWGWPTHAGRSTKGSTGPDGSGPPAASARSFAPSPR